MKISEKSYKSLTTKERVIASFYAKARKDAVEFKKLVRTCPSETCIQNDRAYVSQMEDIEFLSIYAEVLLRDECIMAMANMIANKEAKASDHIKSMAAISEAWTCLLYTSDAADD